MTPELAKKLHQAGYKSKNGAYIPTLEELIEEFEGLLKLTRIISSENITWFAFNRAKTGEGITAEEALANLYLKLHENDKTN